MALIEINGKKIEAEQGSMIIEAADNAGIWIPRFCYHKKLSIAANCRMCLIEVEKSPKALPACATPITDGMKVWTRSPKALQAQKAVMEFLLANHPLDCPICDQGGECELQDIAMGYGKDASRFKEGKRSVLDQDIGPLVSTDMTRCIQCTRCVRFGTEVAGLRELGALGRGEALEIGTFVEKSMVSELSGNVIDICPVGALTSKPYRFSARAWELAQKPSIAPHDCVGSHVFLHLRSNEVMRVVPRENESINEVWLSDRDRFSYEGLSHQRLEKPQMKIHGQWQTVDWEEALEYAAEKLLACQIKEGAATASSKLGALVSPNATTEECYLLQKLLRGLGSHNIDYRLRQLDFSDQDLLPLFPNAGLKIADLEFQSTIVLIGSDIRSEQPLLGLKLRKTVMAGGQVFLINPVDFDMNFKVAHKIIVEGADLCQGLAMLAKALIDLTGQTRVFEEAPWLKAIEPTFAALEMATQLQKQENNVILLGTLALHHPEAAQLRALCHLIASLVGIKFGCLTDGANAAGASIAGALPHRLPGGLNIIEPGLHAEAMSRTAMDCLLLFNLDPELDCAASASLLNQLKNTPTVIALTPFENENLREVADLLLPIGLFSENTGTYVNMEGRWQTFNAAANPVAEARPAWKILRVLGNLCDLEGFEYTTTEQVLYDIKSSLAAALKTDAMAEELPVWQKGSLRAELYENRRSLASENSLIRLGPIPSFSVDNLLRRAVSLQQAEKERLTLSVEMNLHEAQKRGLKAGDWVRLTIHENHPQSGARFSQTEVSSSPFPVSINPRLPNQVLSIPAGLPETIGLGVPYASVEVQHV